MELFSPISTSSFAFREMSQKTSKTYIKVFPAFYVHIPTKSVNLCTDFQWMFDFPLISHRCVFYFQTWHRFSSVCSVNQRLQTKFFVKVWRANVAVPSKWNGISGNDWRTHSNHRELCCTVHPLQPKQQEVWQTAAQSSWFIEAKMAIIKPQFYMRFKSICSFNLFFLCHYFLWFAAENKVVTDKSERETETEGW